MGEWDESAYVIHKKDKGRAVGRDRTLLIMQDPKRELDATLCNISRNDGTVCRLLKAHDGPHIPFTGELISTIGVYVVAVVENDTP